MKKIKIFFGTQLDFRVQLFNILAAAGTLISFITGVTGLLVGAGFYNFLLNMMTMALSALLLWYSYASGKYQLCYTISIICIFFGLFSSIFFSAGGYHSSMPLFFIFAVVFTVFMLEGKKMIIITVLEVAFYSSLCVFAYYNPGTVDFLDNEAKFLIDIIIGIIVVSAALGVTMALHLRLYNLRQKELETARRQVEEYANMKSELFAGMSHEMRTPLTVMSAYAQFAVEQIKESSAAGSPGVNEQTLADLATISDEAKRLAEMADGTLKILMTVPGTRDAGGQNKTPVNMGILSSRLVNLLKPVALRKGKELSIELKDNIPEIPGDADALTQLVWNILQNAITHSNGKKIALNAEADSGGVKITVYDDGTGIDPDLLPRVFERGVSGRNGGSGLGLSICKDIAKRHGGEISIKSKSVNLNGQPADAGNIAADAGVSVTVLLRGLGV
ncbi:MAG: HAMP domain-containing histidine kinase [Treponema sp.]|nr:HAMP domain-containing histidine kinase [Treponema sp.]